MIRILPVLGLALLAVLLVAADGDRPAVDGTTRFLLTVVRQDPGAAGEGTPLDLTELGKPAAPVGPTAANLAADGFVAAVPHGKKILEAIRARGAADVLYRGECETRSGAKAMWETGRKFPVPIVSLRGDARTVSTSYEQTGAELEVEWLKGTNRVVAQIEFSAARRLHGQVGCIIDQHQSCGTVQLPDGYTAIFTFLNRVPAEILNRMPKELATDAAPQPDLVTQYWVLLTRMDVAPAK
ncbi:MAG: hypothetical protein ABFS86_10325 [Planctomycetota bacterium]